MRSLAWILTVFALGSFAPPAGASATCALPDPTAVQLPDGYYQRTINVAGTAFVQVWKETNGNGGLQTTSGICSDGTTWTPDQLVSSTPLNPNDIGNLPP